MFTDKGEEMAADLWDGTITAPVNWYIGSGIGATAPAGTDTALVTEVESRVVAVNTQPSANVNRHVGLVTYTATRTITEAGLFDAASAGNMPVRETFAGIGVNAGDKIEFTFDITTTGS